MAKVSLNKITPIKKVDPITLQIGDSEIIVQQYLPIETKMAMMQDVLNAVIDDTGHINPVRMEVFFNVYLLKYYTNISITDTMLGDPSKTYDLLIINDVLDTIIAQIPETEYADVFDFIVEASENVITYNNSVLGILRNIAADYKNTEIDIDKIGQALNDPKQLTLVKNILEKMG